MFYEYIGKIRKIRGQKCNNGKDIELTSMERFTSYSSCG